MPSSKCHPTTAYHILPVFKNVLRRVPVQFCTDKGWTKMLHATMIWLYTYIYIYIEYMVNNMILLH